MSHLRVLCFEALEERKLLSRAHVVAHHKPAVAASAVALTGTLTVNNKASTTAMDDAGDTTTSIPVTGRLGALGEVHGVWNESADQYGDYLGPDTIQLHDASGSIVVEFNEQNNGPAQRHAAGATEYTDRQIAADGTGAYARAKESGTIVLTTNAARTLIASMTLSTGGT